MPSEPTVEVCQLWVKPDGRVVKAVRASRYIEEFIGLNVDDLKATMEAEGWRQIAALNVADSPDETQIVLHRQRIVSS
jgi:hypothetical protein